MKKLMAAFTTCLLVLLCAGCEPKTPFEAEYTLLGVPEEDTAIVGTTSRCIWDIEVYDDMLFIGQGDYDKNHGPVYMWQYDLKTNEWSQQDVLQDEQINRFYVFNSVLYAPGTDPKDSWELGNYYTYSADNPGWQTHRTLPGGVHAFDMIRYDGKLFAGLGVVSGDSPIVVTADEKTWEEVFLYKDGKRRDLVDSSYIRVYDFFEFDGSLYAYFYLWDNCAVKEIYRYDGEKFVYHSDMIGTMEEIRHTYSSIMQKTEFKEYEYIVNGNLYKTADMITAEKISLGENIEVADARVEGKNLYVLCNEEIETGDDTHKFRVSVLRSGDGETFSEMFYFYFPVRALSFTYHKKHVYFGMGYGTKTNEYLFDNGSVLSVEYRMR